MFSNYGSKSNELYLYTYGFSCPSNENDLISLKMCIGSRDGNSNDTSNVNNNADDTSDVAPVGVVGGGGGGTYYVGRGGYDGIPRELWIAMSFALGSQTEDSAQVRTLHTIVV